MSIQSLVDTIIAYDHEFFLRVNIGLNNSFCDFLFSNVLFFIKIPGLIAICIIFFLLGKNRGRIAAVLSMACLFFTWLIVSGIKDLFTRPLPMETFENVNLMGSSSSSFFPSWQAIAVTVVATIISRKFKVISPIFIILVLLVGLASVYSGRCYPLDIVAGIIFGYFMGVMFLGVDDLFHKIFSRGQDY